MHKCFYSQLRFMALFSLLSAFGASSAAAQEQATQVLPTTPVTQAQAKSSGQDTPGSPGKIDFSKSRKAFPNMLAPYEGRTLPSPKLNNSPRIRQLIHDNKLMLSLNDAIALALENNLDLAI